MRTKTEEEKVLSEELSKCMLSHYKYCAAGMLMGLPLSIHRKSYWPVTLAAVAGTAADFMDGNTNCRQQREALLACIARNESAEAAKGQSAGGAQQPPAEPRQEWPEQQEPQGGWPDKGWEEEAGSASSSGGGSEGGGEDGQREGKWKW